jgi:hypothetical protein
MVVSARAGAASLALPRGRGMLSAPGLVLVAELAVVAALLLALLPDDVHGDTFIALMAGREVAQHGIPSHESLTIASYGRPWIDQQWLAQLCIYGVYRLGGLALLGLVNVTLVFGGVLGGTLGALRLGARPRSVAWLLALAVCGLPVGLEVRTQVFAYPLMVALVYLLARDARRPSAAVWWCLPLLVLWGNLHGSAIMAAGLVCCRALTMAWERRQALARSARAWRRPVGLLLGAPLCLMANPYGPSIVSYYHATLFNPKLRELIAEWQPGFDNLAMTIWLVLVVGVTVWSLVRYPRRSTWWERVALLALAIGGVVAVRNEPWLALGGLMLLPVWIDPGALAPAWRRGPHWLGPLAIAAAAFGVVWVVQGAVATLTRTATSWMPEYPARAVASVGDELKAHPTWRVYADATLADWLLWDVPALRGHLVTDARFELLTQRQLERQVELLAGAGAGWDLAAQNCRLVLLEAALYPHAAAAFRHERGARTIYAGDGVVMVARTAAAAAS